jgi:hypothetical protein
VRKDGYKTPVPSPLLYPLAALISSYRPFPHLVPHNIHGLYPIKSKMQSALLFVAFLSGLVAANPIAAPNPDPVAAPYRFYMPSGTPVPTDPPPRRKRSVEPEVLVMKRDEIVPPQFLRKRELQRRTNNGPSPTTGDWAERCGDGGNEYVCGASNNGTCCSSYVCSPSAVVETNKN